MFNFNFNRFDEYEVKMELFLGAQLVQSNTISAPEIMLRVQIQNVIHQLAQDGRPMRVKFSRIEQIQDIDKKSKDLELCIDFKNNAYDRAESED